LISHKANNYKKILIRFVFSLALLFWIIGIISPCLSNNFLYSIYPYQKLIYSNVCHQNNYKSFTCNDIPLLVCARCSGIYFGAFFTSILILLLNIKLKIKTKHLLILSLPMLTDVIFLSLSFYNYNKMISAFTGFLFGSVVFIYILSGIENLLFTKKNNL
jgi:uncharacterized membrane protein